MTRILRLLRMRGAPVLLALAAIAVTAAPAFAQVFTGRIDIVAQDATGGVLPGVTVDITGPRSASLQTDARGEAHFLDLPPGTYAVKATLQGFIDYNNPNVPVVAGGSVPLRLAMRVAGVAEQVQVTAESPVIDTKRQTTTTNVTLEELQNIPNSRDPWVVMQTVPGIIVDRVNVGGAESGQQSNFTAKGSGRGEATWNIDGVPVTDMAATGATSTYFDFDAFQEISVTTGGSDPRSATPGVQLNFALKTGGDTPRGSARIYFENEDLQSNNMPAALAAAIGGRSGKGNRTDQYADYGFDLGGPLVKGRAWAWGSYGKTDVRIRTLTDVLDRTILENYAFKPQVQLTDAIRAGFTYFRGDKLKFGRGASASRPDETTFNQSGPTSIYKGEVSWAGTNLFLTGRVAYADMGFGLEPRGGRDKSTYQDDQGVWHQSYWFYSTERPQNTANAEGNYFKGRQEFKFGYSYRKFPVDSTFGWPGTKIVSYHIGYPDIYAKVARDYPSKTEGQYHNLYVGDTLTFDRATLNLGVRWDYQTSSLLPVSVQGVRGAPEVERLLPALNAPGVDDAIKYNTLTPRVGFTYALDDNRKTIARASYARFASQLGAADASHVGVVNYSYLYYFAVDRNGNQTAEFNEILFNLGLDGYTGVDINNPTSLKGFNKVDPDLNSPITDEFIFGVDRELMPNFGVSASFNYRYFSDLTWRPLIGVRRSAYRQTGTLSGTEPEIGSFNVPFFAVNASAIPPGAGRELTNREGYHQRYLGFEVSATKRMSNRWMARFGFSTNDHNEYFDNPDTAISDPTPNPIAPLRDGGEIVLRTGGSGKSQIYLILPKYQIIANGLYQGPWDINFGANYVVRQGFGQPFFQDRVATGDPLGRKSVLLVSDVDENRLPAVHSLDVRIEKAFRFRRSNWFIDFDIFNLTNNATVLGRQFNRRLTGATGFQKTTEIMNPRIARIGLRITM